MRPGWTVGLILAAIILAWSIHGALVIGARREVPVTPPAAGPAYEERGLTEVDAALHLHTRASWDGVGTYAGLLDAARRDAIPVLFLSEHNNCAAWDQAGYHDGVLVVPGTEVSLPEGHECVWGASRASLEALFARREVSEAALDTLVRAEHAVGVVAHPRDWAKVWRGPFPEDARGVEIVNGDVQWRANRVRDLVRALVFYPLDSRPALASLVKSPVGALAWWDTLLAARDVFATAGLDAHGGIRLGKNASIGFPSYVSLLRLARQHILVRGPLPADGEAAASALVEALGEGRSYLAFDCFASARGFAYWGSSAGRTAVMGDSLTLAPGALLIARIPREAPALIRLVRAGAGAEGAGVVAEIHGWDAEFPVREPGRYRIEVYLERTGPFAALELPWIYSNPIRVVESEAGAAN